MTSPGPAAARKGKAQPPRPAPVVLDWRDRSHFAGTSTEPQLRRCRRCRGLTPLRDEAGLPCHKVCAELEAGIR